MEKVRKYSSFQEMKDTATNDTVSAAVLAERQKRFENFIDSLRGDNPPEKSRQSVGQSK